MEGERQKIWRGFRAHRSPRATRILVRSNDDHFTPSQGTDKMGFGPGSIRISTVGGADVCLSGLGLELELDLENSRSVRGAALLRANAVVLLNEGSQLD